MKKVLSILLAVIMLVSTIAISGIVTSSAADVNPSDDAYVYYTDATDVRKSGFAYDFEDFTLDPAKLSSYTADMWIFIGPTGDAEAVQYDFLVSLYTEGHYDATVGTNYSEKWFMRKEWKTGQLELGWNHISMALSDFALGSSGNDAYNKPAYAAWQQSGKVVAMTVHENTTAGQPAYGSYNFAMSSFTISDGTNTYNVIDPAKEKAASDIVKCHTGNTNSKSIGVELVKNLRLATDNPANDAYVYNTTSGEVRKSGFAYDFENITLDPAKFGEYSADIWLYIAPKDNETPMTYDFLISLYTDGRFDTSVGNNYTELWAFRKEWKDGFTAGWNHITVPFIDFKTGDKENPHTTTSWNTFNETGILTAMTFHENADANYGTYDFAISSFTITDGVNTYNVIDPAKEKKVEDIKQTFLSNTTPNVLAVKKVAELVPPEPKPEPETGKVIDLVPAYGEKSEDNMIEINTGDYNGDANLFGVLGADELDAPEEMPAADVYYAETYDSTVKSGLMIDIGEVDARPLLSNYINNTDLFVDMWIWVEDAADFKNPIFRMFEDKYNVSNNYIEYNLVNKGFKVESGWNHVTFAVGATTGSGSAVPGNNYINHAQQKFATEGILRYIAVYTHDATLSDYAVAAVRLIEREAIKDDSWDLTAAPNKYLYYEDETVADSDFTVTYKGEVVTDYTVTLPEGGLVTGKNDIVINYNGLSVMTQVNIKARGNVILDDVDLNSATGYLASGGSGFNKDNFVVGKASTAIVTPATGQSPFVTSKESGFGPLDLSGEDYLEVYVYVDPLLISDDNVQFTIEIGSGSNYSSHSFRYQFGATVKDGSGATAKVSDLVKAGWNKLRLPINDIKLDDSKNTFQPVKDGVRVVTYHSSQKNNVVDWSALTFCRMWIQNGAEGAVTLWNGLGYGSDVEVNGKYAGNDLQTAIDIAKAGDTVKLNWSQDINETIVVNKNFTLDLNGNDITSNVEKAFASEGGVMKYVDTNLKFNHSVSGAEVFGPSKGKFNVFDSSVVEVAGEASLVDADDASIAYKGNWQSLKNLKGANNKSLMRSTDAGDSYVFYFTGNAFGIYGYTSNTYANIEVYIDDEYVTLIDLYSDAPVYQKLIFATMVTEGTHKVEVKAINLKNENAAHPTLFYNAIDAILVSQTLETIEAEIVETKNVTIKADTATFKVNLEGHVNGAAEGITAVAENGTVEVVDGVINYTAGSSKTDVITYVQNGLAGQINLTIDVPALEAEKFMQTLNVDGEEIENEVMNLWKFSGHNALVLEADEYVEFTFEGDSFELIGYTSQKYGQFEIYIDNFDAEVVDEKADGYNYQESVYSVDGLGEGEHVVTIYAIDKVIIDAIVVE